MPTNFIFILADDLGYADLGCYGGRAPVSPNIDRMAAEGLRFTQGYANSPVCSPTRFALMTGRYQYRLRGAAEEPIGSAMRGDKVIGLPPEHPTLPSLPRGRGLPHGADRQVAPRLSAALRPAALSGYDEFFGPMSGGVDYFTHRTASARTTCSRTASEVNRDGYLTDLLSRARRRLRRARCAGKKQPFLLSLHYTAPHWPWETRDDGELAEDVRQGQPDLSPRRRQHPRLPAHDPSHGRGHRPDRSPRSTTTGIARDTHRRLHQRQRRRALLRQLAAGRRQDGPDRRRHPRALDRALAGAHRPPATTTEQLAITMDWVPTFLEAAGVVGRIPTIRATASRCCRRSPIRAPSPSGRCSGA